MGGSDKEFSGGLDYSELNKDALGEEENISSISFEQGKRAHNSKGLETFPPRCKGFMRRGQKITFEVTKGRRSIVLFSFVFLLLFFFFLGKVSYIPG